MPLRRLDLAAEDLHGCCATTIPDLTLDFDFLAKAVKKYGNDGAGVADAFVWCDGDGELEMSLKQLVDARMGSLLFVVYRVQRDWTVIFSQDVGVFEEVLLSS